MHNPTPYLKMRVLGAIDMAPGNTSHARIVAVSQMTFTDKDVNPRRFTWRTILTWHSRYKKHGVTLIENKPRSCKCKNRKVQPEALLEDIRTVLPKLRETGRTPDRARSTASALSRGC
jgi:putative transposase